MVVGVIIGDRMQNIIPSFWSTFLFSGPPFWTTVRRPAGFAILLAADCKSAKPK